MHKGLSERGREEVQMAANERRESGVGCEEEQQLSVGSFCLAWLCLLENDHTVQDRERE